MPGTRWRERRERSDNLMQRLQHRETFRSPPCAQLHSVRRLYENIVPSHTVYDVESPEHVIRRFSHDGQYLICFSRNGLELIVYRFLWFHYCAQGAAAVAEAEEDDHLPPSTRKFEKYFEQLYCAPLGRGSEVLCKDLFLCCEGSALGVFASATPADLSSPPRVGAVKGVPAMESITLHLVRLADGKVVDRRVFRDDYINLTHNGGAFLYEDLLSVLSIRFQRIHLFQIVEAAERFVDVQVIGPYGCDDDELVLQSHFQEEWRFQRHLAELRRRQALGGGAASRSLTMSTFGSSLFSLSYGPDGRASLQSQSHTHTHSPTQSHTHSQSQPQSHSQSHSHSHAHSQSHSHAHSHPHSHSRSQEG
ncbi:hypothetical protein CLOM_g12474 [Closterium sp. NIES-68]|nr:hypothetical protein CLOM_g12474 [Closterium sp. NIES-68]